MTKNDLRNLIDIIDNIKKEEAKRCNRYIELNPDDANNRRTAQAIFNNGVNSVWLDIRKKYADVWESDE